MGPSSVLDLISKEKIHYFFALIPLISFILFWRNFWVITIYTAFFALWVVYISCLIAFKKKSAETLLNPPKNLNKLDFIPYIPLFIVTLLIVLSAFLISVCLSTKHLNDNFYSFILFLAHIFLASFMIFLLLVIRYYKKIKADQ